MLQYKSCHGASMPLDNNCRDCCTEMSTGRFDDDSVCRFKNFRTFNYEMSESGVSVLKSSFLDPTQDPTEDEKSLWLPNKKDAPLINLDKDSCAEILQMIGHVMRKILNQERALEKLDSFIDGVRYKFWKKHVYGIRELCDRCKTSIFNSHWTCEVCGFVVCPDCFVTRFKIEQQNERAAELCMNERDKFGWFGCTSNLSHSTKSLWLTQIIPCNVTSEFADILDDIMLRLGIISPNYPKPPSESLLKTKKDTINYIQEMKMYNEFNANHCMKTYLQSESSRKFPKIQHMWMCYGKLLRLMEPENSENIKMFQEIWPRGQPLLVSGVHLKIDQRLWSPEVFEQEYGDESQEIIDCVTGQVQDKITFKQFWQGFRDTQKQQRNTDGIAMSLKVKDWPPSIDFEDFSLERFNDFTNALPLKEFTIRTGRMNLVTRLPDTFRKPDLGPRMYIAFSEGVQKDMGTTKLHLDVSDAINILVNVCVPLNSDIEYEKKYVEQTILDSGCDAKTMHEALKQGSIPGAIWHIYRASDADKIRRLLIKIASESENVSEFKSDEDPIHDQSTYLNKNIRQRLAQEENVIGFTIIQCLGDAVFIPAGCPHQVRNLRNCVKVAEDFVSPSSIANCLNLTQEFRSLSDLHTNHEDKLQIKNIIYHSVKDVLSVLINWFETK